MMGKQPNGKAGNYSPPFGEYRALEVMSIVPTGCIAHFVTDSYSAPHLRIGETAIADTNDRQPQNGELFVIQWESGRRAIVQAQSREFNFCEGGPAIGWMVGDLVRPRDEAEFQACLRAGILRTADGPYRTDHLASKLVGRVIGIFEAPSTPLRLPAAR